MDCFTFTFTSLMHGNIEWHDLAKNGRTSARLLLVWLKHSMSQKFGCLENLQTGTLSMVTSVWGTKNIHRGIYQGCRANGGAS